LGSGGGPFDRQTPQARSQKAAPGQIAHQRGCAEGPGRSLG
jgi:hypothetical protein